ncbi:MAG TPA: RES family NAD+ phosphorylase [Burkholderiaceae bacterium]|nr:RES family NAD+ phosphorylase [Burkholderiaceae bacterium]
MRKVGAVTTPELVYKLLADRGQFGGRVVMSTSIDTKAPVPPLTITFPSKVAVAKFGVVRPLRLLDLTFIEDVHDDGSIFDPSLKGRLERVAFLRTLGQRMTRPVMPDDEAFDYLATQAVADFLATMNEPRLDGIIFSSAQSRAGRNVVLFHHAARVERRVLPDGTEVAASTGNWTEDGWEVDYWVSERVPPSPVPPPPDRTDPLFDFLLDPGDPPSWADDLRVMTLKIEPESVAVHHVNWVDINTTRFAARRHQFEKREPKFKGTGTSFGPDLPRNYWFEDAEQVTRIRFGVGTVSAQAGGDVGLKIVSNFDCSTFAFTFRTSLKMRQISSACHEPR